MSCGHPNISLKECQPRPLPNRRVLWNSPLPGFTALPGGCLRKLSFVHSLRTLTSSNKESWPFSWAIIAFGVFPLFLLPLAMTAFGGPEGYFNLTIIAFGAFEFFVPKCDYRLGSTNQNLPKKRAPRKTITFYILQNTGDKQKNVLLQPPSWPKMCVFVCFETKNIHVEPET